MPTLGERTLTYFLEMIKRAKSTLESSLEFSILLIASAICIVTIIADFFGYLHKFHWMTESIPKFSLLLLSLTTVYILNENKKYSKRGNDIKHQLHLVQEAFNSYKSDNHDKHQTLSKHLHDSITTIIGSLSGVEIKQYTNLTSIMEYITKRLEIAEKSVDELTWSHKQSCCDRLPNHKLVMEKYHEMVEFVSNRVTYREVFRFNKKGRTEILKKRIQKRSTNYSCGYYSASRMPLIQFIIIDKEEVVFVGDALFVLHSKQLAHIFTNYFEDVWNLSNKLIDGEFINHKEIQKIFNIQFTE